MKRLFIAVDLDEGTREAVAGIATRLAERLRGDRGAGRITWVRKEHLHLTLRFLGDVEDARVVAVQEAMAAPLAVAGFDLSFEGLGLFTPAGRPRVMWLGVRDGRPELEALDRAVEDRLRQAGVPPESRSFLAHLTIGRFRDAAVRLDLDASPMGHVRVGPCRVDHVTVYESRLSSAGPTYTAIAQSVTRAHG